MVIEVTSMQKYLDSAVAVLERVGIMPQEEENQLVQLLEDVKNVDEAKVTAIAKTIRYMSSFNDLVRDKVGDMHVATRYEEINSSFDSIIEDSRDLVDYLKDGKLSFAERVQIGWMKVSRGTTHKRFEKIRDTYNDVTKDTRTQIEKETEILDAYIDFRFALKDAEAVSHELLKIHNVILEQVRTALETAIKTVTDYQGTDESERTRLELARDEAKRAYEKEDRRHQLINDVQINISVGYDIGDTLMAKLSQTHNLKEQVYRRAVTFFTTNEHVFTTLDALFTAQQGLHETTQTIEAMKAGAEKSLAAVADLGREFEKAAIKAGYGRTISAEAAQKLLDSVVSYQTESIQLIAEARKEATENADQIRQRTETARRQVADTIVKYLRPAA